MGVVIEIRISLPPFFFELLISTNHQPVRFTSDFKREIYQKYTVPGTYLPGTIILIHTSVAFISLLFKLAPWGILHIYL
jgi:hypothetical protein